MTTSTEPKAKSVPAKTAAAKRAAVKPKTTTPAVVAVKVEPPKVKLKKVKQVRDSFTMPKDEYEQIATLKINLAKQGRPTKKSELLRAGLLLLSKQTPGALLACVEGLTPIKTGRPRKD
jgi:hypothetical protein